MQRSINQSSKDYILQINGITWKKHYQDLFDYDEHNNDNLIPFSQQLVARQMFVLIWRNKKSLQLTVQTKSQLRKINQKNLDTDMELLCGAKATIKSKVFSIRLYQADEIIKQPKQQNIPTSIYYNQHHIVVRSLKNAEKQPIGFVLKSNNLIKLGNFQFFVHLVNVDNQSDRSLEEMATSLNLNQKQSSESFLKQVTFFINSNQKVYDANTQQITPQAECKYCMMNQSEQQGDFLCSPCKCSGSCGLVHFGCLVKWNKNKVKKTQNKGCVEYDFQKFFCEVCKLQYPQYIKKNKKIYQILPMQKPKTDFIVMQALNTLKRHIIIVQNLNQDGLVIGRGQDCGLRLDDSTISRRHAVIKKVKDDFVIFDLKSKFGTLIRDIAFKYQLFKGDKFSIQAGGTVLSFSLTKKSNQTLSRT